MATVIHFCIFSNFGFRSSLYTNICLCSQFFTIFIYLTGRKYFL